MKSIKWYFVIVSVIALISVIGTIAIILIMALTKQAEHAKHIAPTLKYTVGIYCLHQFGNYCIKKKNGTKD